MNHVTDCFTSCQEKTEDCGEEDDDDDKSEAGASSTELSYVILIFLILIYFVEDPFENKETGVMRNFNLHYDFCLIFVFDLQLCTTF